MQVPEKDRAKWRLYWGVGEVDPHSNRRNSSTFLTRLEALEWAIRLIRAGIPRETTRLIQCTSKTKTRPYVANIQVWLSNWYVTHHPELDLADLEDSSTESLASMAIEELDGVNNREPTKDFKAPPCSEAFLWKLAASLGAFRCKEDENMFCWGTMEEQVAMVTKALEKWDEKRDEEGPPCTYVPHNYHFE